MIFSEKNYYMEKKLLYMLFFQKKITIYFFHFVSTKVIKVDKSNKRTIQSY